MLNILGKGSLTAAFLLAGSSVISFKLLMGQLGIFTMISLSLVLSILIVFPFYYRQLLFTCKCLTRKEWFMICLQALLGMFLFRLFILTGLKYTSAGEAGLLLGTTPAITCCLAYFVLKEKLTYKAIAGILCVILGMISLQDGHVVAYSLDHLLGNMLILCAAACESAFNIFSRKSSIDRSSIKIRPMIRTILVCFIVLVPCTILALFEFPLTSLRLLDTSGWLALIWQGLFVTIVAYFCWFTGIRYCTASTAAAFSGFMPLSSVLLSVFILNEHLTMKIVLAGVAIIVGVVMISFNPQEEEESFEPISVED